MFLLTKISIVYDVLSVSQALFAFSHSNCFLYSEFPKTLQVTSCKRRNSELRSEHFNYFQEVVWSARMAVLTASGQFTIFMLITDHLHSLIFPFKQKYVLLGHSAPRRITNKVTNKLRESFSILLFYLILLLQWSYGTHESISHAPTSLQEQRSQFFTKATSPATVKMITVLLPPVGIVRLELQPSFCLIIFYSFILARKASAGFVNDVR